MNNVNGLKRIFMVLSVGLIMLFIISVSVPSLLPFFAFYLLVYIPFAIYYLIMWIMAGFENK